MMICAVLICALTLATQTELTDEVLIDDDKKLDRFEKDAGSKVEMEIALFDKRLRKYYNRLLIQPKWEEMLAGGITAFCKLADLSLLVAMGDTPLELGKHVKILRHKMLKPAFIQIKEELNNAVTSLYNILDKLDKGAEATIKSAREVLIALVRDVNEKTNKLELLGSIKVPTNIAEQTLKKTLKIIPDNSAIFKTFKQLTKEINESLPLGDPNVNAVKQQFQEVANNIDLFSNIFAYFGEQLQMQTLLTTTTNNYGKTTLETLLADVVASSPWSANLSEKIFETGRLMFANYVTLICTKRLIAVSANATFGVQQFASKELASITQLIGMKDQNENAVEKSKNAKFCQTNIAELNIATSKWKTDFGEFVEKYVTKIKHRFKTDFVVLPK